MILITLLISALEFEQSVYEVAENIGEDNFALRVCFRVSGGSQSPRNITLITSDFSATGKCFADN